MLKDKQGLTDEGQAALGLFLIGDGYMKGIYLKKHLVISKISND
jgi:hypothetical protein